MLGKYNLKKDLPNQKNLPSVVISTFITESALNWNVMCIPKTLQEQKGISPSYVAKQREPIRYLFSR